ncbi:MAG: glycosyltransferase family 4 protein [Candidatus Microsaccharimonas sp.]
MQKLARLAFFHDSKFKRTSKDEYYTSGSLTSELLAKRYLFLADKLTVVARQERVSSRDASKLVSSDYKDIDFSCLDSLNPVSLLFGSGRRIIRQSVSEASFSVIRLPSIIGLIAFLEARRQKKSFLVEMVACPFDSLWNYGKLRYKLAAIILFYANRFAVLKTPYVVYVTDSFLQKRYPTKGISVSCSDVVINNSDEGILNSRLNRIKSQQLNRKIIIGTIANVGVKYKGHQYVIEAVSKLIDKGYDIEYQMVGGGDQKFLMQIAKQNGVEDHVVFLGVMDRHEILNWLDNVDYYAQLSLQEGLPRALIEAMSRGCLCVGSRVGGIPELLRDNFIVPKKNSDGLVTIIDSKKDDLDTILNEAVYNINRSTDFNENVLDEKRNRFYDSILKLEIE